MRLHFTLIFAAGLALSGCSINDDLRSFGDTVPARVTGLAWPALVPLGAFAGSPTPPMVDPRSIAARAAALRRHAAQLRARPVLDPARARALRAALRKYAP